MGGFRVSPVPGAVYALAASAPGREPFVLRFGIKAATEVEHDGETGLLIEGYASRFGEQDRAGEVMLPGAFRDIAETWGAEPEPLVIYHHGMDPALRMRRIGKAITWAVDETGLWVKSFIPKTPRFTDARAVARFREVYDGIRQGRIRGYSVGGFCTTVGKAIVQWSKSELSITPTPCLTTATFTLGTNAVKALLGDVPLLEGDAPPMTPAPMTTSPLAEGTSGGILSRPNFGRVMRMAQADKDHALHDHLLARPTYTHGEHDAGDCAICGERREFAGIKAKLDAADRNALEDSDFAYIDSDGGRHLPIHDAAHVRAAMARFNQTHFESASAKEAARRKILAAAKKFGIDAEGFAGEGEAESKDGKKAVAEAQAILARYTAAAKAGRRFSAASTASIQKVIDLLQELIADEQREDDTSPVGDTAAETD
jgi:HK97 family phage prohead protease